MSDPYVGEIRLFAGNFAPVNWHLCDGSLLPIANNQTLFSLIGATYGGDGRTTFALPDLRGRVPMNWGAGPGLTSRTIGQSFGAEEVQLTQVQMPQHNHAFVATTATADDPSPGGKLFADNGQDTLYAPPPSTGAQVKTMNPASVSEAGGSQPHNNIMQSMAMNYIICLVGVYPPRS